ncbi:unnamed protein product [Caenorhabditis auriculariae]|uniref:Transcription factor CBF/NF-Y/archaeal histone domain-containing protein n=1 Tax=Caenorhabditis auriculariae TaxID=2777116 RepID=A0A8S1HLI3_9PELO|nr:unnamed protein product [Caenorhabditis auriculariae]
MEQQQPSTSYQPPGSSQQYADNVPGDGYQNYPNNIPNEQQGMPKYPYQTGAESVQYRKTRAKVSRLNRNLSPGPIKNPKTPTTVSPVKEKNDKELHKWFWEMQRHKMENMDEDSIRHHCRHMNLPMARVKKIMKLDDEVKGLMIASDAPVFMSAASEMFVQEMTMLGWQVVDEGRRKTMQKADLVSAVHKNEQFDFLVDLLPADANKQSNGVTVANLPQTGITDDGQQIQYVIADPSIVTGNHVYQLDDGQYVQATPIGNPIPLGAEGSEVHELPPGMQLIQVTDEADVVAMFTHNKPLALEKITLIRHDNDDNRTAPLYSVKQEASDRVVELGQEVNCIEEGFDFAIAIVDKETGEVTMKPARVYQFEGRSAEDASDLTMPKRKLPTNYDKDYSIKSDKWAEKRRQLTENFGSTKKLKIQEAVVRRTIKTETLDEMRKTAFASNSNIKDEDIKVDQISLINKAVSSILPPAVQAELARDIYPLSTFISDEEIEIVSDDALELFKDKKKKELLAAGVPEPLAIICSLRWLNCSRLWEKQGTISRKELNELKMSSLLRQKIQTEFFLESEFNRGLNGKGPERIRLAKAERDRFVSYTLALALHLAPGHLIPITGWQMALNYPPSKLEKLLEGLGCDILKLNTEDAMRYMSLRAARLLRPPSAETKQQQKLRRR